MQKPNEEFYSIPLYIDNRVLIPRNDTEIMVDKVIKTIKTEVEIYDAIDVWTWSWAIIIAVYKNNDKISNYIWIDISQDALDISKINLWLHNLENKIKLINWDLLQTFLQNEYKFVWKNIIITANLPYIKNWDFINMDKEVIQNEPHIALFWWENTWFEIYERLLEEIKLFKKKYSLEKVILFIEIWFDQYNYSKNFLEKLNLNFEYFKDLNNIYRIIKIYL